MSKKNDLVEPHLYRVVLAVAAGCLPQVHTAISAIAAVVEIEHWYDPAEVSAVEQDASDEPAPKTKKGKVDGGMTLVDQVLHNASRAGGVTRKQLKAIAEEYGFNVGSVSPTLVKLVASKRLKRIGKGMYATAGRKK